MRLDISPRKNCAFHWTHCGTLAQLFWCVILWLFMRSYSCQKTGQYSNLNVSAQTKRSDPATVECYESTAQATRREWITTTPASRHRVEAPHLRRISRVDPSVCSSETWTPQAISQNVPITRFKYNCRHSTFTDSGFVFQPDGLFQVLVLAGSRRGLLLKNKHVSVHQQQLEQSWENGFTSCTICRLG